MSDAGQPTGPAARVVTDYRAMRALAHPTRLALLDAIRREGTLTAGVAAELLGDSPGNMSWHLQTLAKYGFIEEAGGGRGRSRPWRAVTGSISFTTENDDPQAAGAGQALELTTVSRSLDRLREWWSARLSFPLPWRKAAFLTRTTTYVTPAELSAIEAAVHEVLAPYAGRLHDTGARPEGAYPAEILVFGHPLPPTPSGN